MNGEVTYCANCKRQYTTADCYCAVCGKTLQTHKRQSNAGALAIIFGSVFVLLCALVVIVGVGELQSNPQVSTVSLPTPTPTPTVAPTPTAPTVDQQLKKYLDNVDERALTERSRVVTRENLTREYQAFLHDTNPHLNYIEGRVTKVKGGYALWGSHTYFSQYSFTIGPLGPNVSAWITAIGAPFNTPRLSAWMSGQPKGGVEAAGLGYKRLALLADTPQATKLAATAGAMFGLKKIEWF